MGYSLKIEVLLQECLINLKPNLINRNERITLKKTTHLLKQIQTVKADEMARPAPSKNITPQEIFFAKSFQWIIGSYFQLSDQWEICFYQWSVILSCESEYLPLKGLELGKINGSIPHNIATVPSVT